jgi:hypothetical protein
MNVLYFDTRDVFEPEKIQALAASFEDVLRSVSEADFPHIPALKLRRMVAATIMASAKQGETDPANLRAAALSALAQIEPEAAPADASSADRLEPIRARTRASSGSRW